MFKKITISICVVLIAGCAGESEEENTGEPAAEAGMLTMEGDTGDYVPGETDDPAHDPAMTEKDGTYYVFSTGIERDPADPGGIFVRESSGTVAGPWESIGEIPTPEWVEEYQPNHLWAPQVHEDEGTYYLYYAASSFGSNNSAIGAAVSETPGDPESWEDQGPVITSGYGETDYNAIDPHVFEAEGDLWMVFGSHFSGIQLTRMEDPLTASEETSMIASRPEDEHNAIEAPTIIERDGYYYLFTSWDQCCSGTDSTYKIAYGRAESVEGPYEDEDGTLLSEGGGNILLESEGAQIGPGGQDIYREEEQDYLVHHYYDGDADGVIRMQVRELSWEDGWPVLE
ncbi:arabinan endo-1,5-alpha-L-arabinosidase [Alkalicoccus daliensis]|uniref:Endo-alpha-(1->5)-L-arabinanase n=1 Tax=Alkalicoccus daliensis TaxID=745820 RepID=A0A1H0FXC6_9BACI|nr:arabinan endo-1,5-alpha-L-arabinosidase [Alkalicoccus daliensis]SDN99222.1 arabinan endo-1,5-alpha-L-arabinosidase [Alkalicoccus daliensis]